LGEKLKVIKFLDVRSEYVELILKVASLLFYLQTTTCSCDLFPLIAWNTYRSTSVKIL